jgi:hypothetical protein
MQSLRKQCKEPLRRKQMANLTDAERKIIVNALTTASHQYEKDAVTAEDLATHGDTTRASAEALGSQLREQVIDARQLRDKLVFLWHHIQY